MNWIQKCDEEKVYVLIWLPHTCVSCQLPELNGANDPIGENAFSVRFMCARPPEQRRKHWATNELSYLHWHRKWVSFSDETQQIQHVYHIRVRKERTKTHTETHTQTDETLTSAHKSEQVVSTMSCTFNWIHLLSQRQRSSSSHLPGNTALHSRQCSGNFTYSFLHPLRII